MASENLKTELIAETYASVILELAIEEDKCSLIRSELGSVAQVLCDEKEFSSILNSPFVQIREKITLIENVFGERVDRLVTGLMASMLKRDRLRFIKDTTRVYEHLLDEHNGIKIINVTVASEMNDAQKAKLEIKLSEAVDASIKVKYAVDPTILGGIIIRRGGDYVDNSLKRILADTKVKIVNKIKA